MSQPRVSQKSRRKRRSGAPAGPPAGAPEPPAPGRLDAALEWAAPLLALALVARLAGFAAGARFTSDECFHAWMSEWIASHGTLPEVVKGLYGGFKYFYPPLLHLLGAVVVKLFGVSAFRELNVVLLAALFAGLWWGLSRVASRTAAALATLALVAYPGLVLQGVRVYVECLSAALAVGSVVALLAVGRSPSRARAVLLGGLVGLGLLAKQSGLLLLPVLGLLAVLAAWRRQRPPAVAFALALGVACVLAAPFWIRNTLLFGSPVYPVFGRDLDPRLLALNIKGFTPGYAQFMTGSLRQAGWIVSALLAAGLAVALGTRRTFAHLLLAGGLVMLALAPRVPMLDPRHAIPLVAALVVFAAVTLTGAIERSAAARRALLVPLVAFAAWTVATLPNVRIPFDMAASQDEVWAAVRANVPKGQTILSIATYDTFYYTGRDATWPIPWGQRNPPIEMFDDTEPEAILAHLKQHGIRWMLLLTAAPPGPSTRETFHTRSWRGCSGSPRRGTSSMSAGARTWCSCA